jgi:hypothetical protein
MSTSLYEQAIIDAESLKRMAEENARNQVIEAITPQIRSLIESEMLQADSALNEMMGGCASCGAAQCGCAAPCERCGGHPCACEGCSRCGGPLTTEGGCMESSCNAADGACEKCGQSGCDCDGMDVLTDIDTIGEAELRAMEMLVNSAVDVNAREIVERAHNLRRNLAKFIIVKESFDLDKLDNDSRIEFLKRFNDLMREGVILRNETILMNEADTQQVQNLLDKTIKEMKTMSETLNKSLLNRLFEAEEGEEVDLDLGALEVEDAPVEAAEEEVAEDEGVEVPADLLDDPEVQKLLALLAGDEAGEEMAEEAMEETDMTEVYEEAVHEGLDEVFEIDIDELRSELAKLQEGDAKEMADHFGGGEALGDVVFEIDEDDLINVLADELGREDVATPVVESRRHSSRKLQESRKNRVLKSQLTEAKEAVASLQGQLSEMNLFNAKLLYANKLMQDKGLNTKQQRAIVEALDGAETLAEAKLLFQSLTAALGKNKSLSEGKKLGSASKSTRPSGQPLNEGVGTTDRWAVLAGITNQNQNDQD